MSRRSGTRLFGVAVLLLALTAPALGHEQHQVGRYTVEMGWRDEPALEGAANAVYLEVRETATGKPVDALAKTLHVQVAFGGGGQTFEPILRALADTPGAYVGDIIPTRAGEYRFHLTGTIVDVPVDERFETGPGRFDPVTTPTAVQFPDQVGSAADTARAARTARETADQTRVLAIAAVALAGIALVLSGLAARRRP